MANLKQLPVLQPNDSPPSRRSIGAGSLGVDGRRRRPVPADVNGRFVRARRLVYAALILVWAALPWIPIKGHPAVFLDVDRRQFFLFGLTFNAQDAWLLFFAMSGVGFGLVYATALLGRVWCGWACPQTVFLEALFRPLERLVHGPRNVALRRAQSGSLDHVWRVAVTHGGYLVAALLVAHIFLAYFVSIPNVLSMVRARPAAHPEAFAWMAAVTAVVYGNFAFFREQFCVVVCPYGRLQSALIDDDSLVIGYDVGRGEPRGKAKRESAPDDSAKGDCVDCNRCVVVCPTGIDIREGLQLDCIACSACIDACDEVMDKLSRPRGLVRYDSLRGLRGEKRKVLRPRIWAYTALLLLGAVVAAVAFHRREPFEANVVRLVGTPYTREGGVLRNSFELHVVSKSARPIDVRVEATGSPDLAFVIPIEETHIDPLGSRRLPIFVTMPETRFTADVPFELHVTMTDADGTTSDQRPRATFLGARARTVKP
jgi:cytochrome c oxidase accessory protein FixG